MTRREPPTAREVEELVLRIAEQNPGWGYTSLADRLRNLGHEIGRTTVAEILKANGLEPATQRRKRTSWRTFLRAHWSTLAAIDFTTVEVWTATGLATQYVLLVMHLATRRVELAGITIGPGTEWMKQVVRNLTDQIDGFLVGKRYLLMGRPTPFRGYVHFCAMSFRCHAKIASGVTIVATSPNSLRPRTLPRMASFRRCSSVSRSRLPLSCSASTWFSARRYSIASCWLRLIHPASVSSMNCHGFKSGVTIALLHRHSFDDPISGQDEVRIAYRERRRGEDVAVVETHDRSRAV
jgi:hypothetical protein